MTSPTNRNEVCGDEAALSTNKYGQIVYIVVGG